MQRHTREVNIYVSDQAKSFELREFTRELAQPSNKCCQLSLFSYMITKCKIAYPFNTFYRVCLLGYIKLIISFSSTCPQNFDEDGRNLFLIIQNI